MSAHSRLGPSSAKRWLNCPGSVALCAKAPKQPPSEYAAEGTVAHDIAERYVTGKLDFESMVALIGTAVMEGGFEIEVSEEMIDGAVEYHDVIAADRAALDVVSKPLPVLWAAEKRVCAASVDPELWGTADYFQYRKGDTLFIYDYKFGKGVVVSPTRNEQAMIYAIAVMDGEAGWAFDKVVVKIVQPRGSHADGSTREWVTTTAEMRAFRDKLIPAVAATRAAGAQIVAGEWCRWCSAKPYCPVMYEAAQVSAGADFEVVAPAPGGKTLPDAKLLSIEQLAKALAWQDAVESWFVAVKEVVVEKLSAGQEVPGWKLVDGRSNRKWTDEAAVVAKFGAVLGEDKLYVRKIVSPSALEKIVGKKAGVDELTFKPEAKKSVAPDTDPRPKAASSAQDDFKALPAPAPAPAHDDLMAELMGEASPAAPAKREPIWP